MWGAFLSLAALVLCLLPGKTQAQQVSTMPEEKFEPVELVNPFIGTKNMGHTYPGATAPFGMVQLSPDTRQEDMYLPDGSYNKETYRYCSGYQYDDNTIFGFSHTHFSGTGHSDLGDLRIMPTSGELVLEPGDAENPGSGYFSRFSHEHESAEPGYYRVELQDHQINAELTASTRVGLHRYTFEKTGRANIILDLMANIYHHDTKNIWSFVRVENDRLITGYRQTSGWARTRTVYFAMEFSRPFKDFGHKRYDKTSYTGFYRRFDQENNFPEMAGRELRTWFSFELKAGEEIIVKVALSPVSTAGAVKNLKAETDGKSFDQIREETSSNWNQELAKVRATMLNRDDLVTFYTALYHTMLSPIIYEDVDGQYRGLDQNVHQSEGFTNYTIFSLWDTFRALHPLFTITQPARANDMVKSMLAHYQQSVHTMLPIWSHYANENWCMIGYHAVSVLADALAKGVTDVDAKHLLKAAVDTSTVSYFDGLDAYMQHGYVPEGAAANPVSVTLEFAYDDWCIARIARAAGDEETEKLYLQRSQAWRHLYNSEKGFMQSRFVDGSWKEPFDPLDTHGQGFIEGNAWTYSLFVPHDPAGMIELMGGAEAVEKRLDTLFTMELDEKYIAHTEDITRDGIIGNYVHGNEPGHHIAYLYNWTGHPWKTQQRVRMIMDEMYGSGVDGLCGNDDAGQMSAWYIFSALGFYPVAPGSDRYSLGSPLVVEATMHLENGNTLKITTQNQSPENVYMQKVLLNGKLLDRTWISHGELASGGTLTFFMVNEPETD
jgi:predicted alpha-1,2-mannosidase